MATNLKMWLKANEWMSYASCGDSIDHTLPEKRQGKGPVADVGRVVDICGGCRVRPECVKFAVDTKAHSVWVAGQWIPDDKGKNGKVWKNRQWTDTPAERVRKSLAASYEQELSRRGDDV